MNESLRNQPNQEFRKAESVLFIVNHTAGNGLSTGEYTDLEQTAKSYERIASSIEIKHTLEPGHATEIAKDAVGNNISIVIAVGGDGTLSEVINGTAGSDVIVGNIPTGYLNIWAREMGIPIDIKKAGEALLSGTVERIDIGEVNGRKFLQFANLGFDSEEYMKVHKPDNIRKHGGRATFYKTLAHCAINGLFYKGHNVNITLDGEEFGTKLLIGVVGNSRKYGRMTLRDDVVLDDGKLETSFFTGDSAFSFLPEFARIILKKESGNGLLQKKLEEELVIECAPKDKIGVTIDGNPFGYFDTLHARVLPKAQSVLVGN